jgi:hypothetical protein
MDRTKSVVTPERFDSGMTFERYLAYIASPENLEREGSGGEGRKDLSGVVRAWYAASRLSDHQAAGWTWT